MKILITICLLTLLIIGCETPEQQQARYELTQKMNDFVAQHSTEKNKQLIRDGKIAIGMNTVEVLVSIGRPKDKNKTTGAWGEHEQWIYGYYNSSLQPMRFLYFENGILTSWQD